MEAFVSRYAAQAERFTPIVASPFFRGLPWWAYLMLATLPIAFNVVRKTSMFEDAFNYTTAMSSAIALTSLAGILLVAGYVVHALGTSA